MNNIVMVIMAWRIVTPGNTSQIQFLTQFFALVRIGWFVITDQEVVSWYFVLIYSAK